MNTTLQRIAGFYLIIIVVFVDDFDVVAVRYQHFQTIYQDINRNTIKKIYQKCAKRTVAAAKTYTNNRPAN